MAHLVIPRAQDNSGNASSGATLTVYETGTTTKAELYSTAALAEAGGSGDLANPVTASSAGWFAQVFVSENDVLDWQMHTSAGVLLREEEGVQGVPGSPEDINLDLGDDGRFRVTGDANVVQMEFGDPTGDNVGGDGRIGGWAGTPGTSLEIEFDAVDVSGDMTTGGNAVVDGTFTFDGGQTVDLVISEATQASATSHTIALPAGYDIYELDVYNIVGAGTMTGQFSYDSAATFKSTNQYDWVRNEAKGAGTNATTGANADADFEVFASMVNNEASHFTFTITNLADARTAIRWIGSSPAAASLWHITGSCHMDEDYDRATHIKLIGNLACTFKYVLKGRRRSSV